MNTFAFTVTFPFLFAFLTGCAGSKPVKKNEPSQNTFSPAQTQDVRELVSAIEDPSLNTPKNPDNLPENLSSLFQTIYFEYNKFTLPQEGIQQLAKMAEFLSKKKTATLVVQGHCDERGSEEFNLALGEKRARVVQNYLKTYGIHPSRIQLISYGEERPAVYGRNEDAFSKNRRAQFEVGNVQ